MGPTIQQTAGTRKNSAWLETAKTTGLVSVIIPSYNRLTLLPQTLDSIWQQTFRPIELIVVDDGSTDGTPDIAEKWALEHNADPAFITRIFRQENQGAPAARNAGARFSSGEYIQFFDSDDLMRPEKLARSIEILRAQPELDFVSCDFFLFQEKDGVIHPEVRQVRYSQRKGTIVSYINCNYLNTPSPLFRRASLNTVGPWCEDLQVWEDFEYGFRVIALLQGHWLSETLYDVRITPHSISDDKAKRNDPTRGDAYIRSCTRIEEKARELKIYPEIIRRELGLKLEKQTYSLSGKRCWQAYDIVSKAACDRLGIWKRLALTWHRLRLKIRRKY
jgi:glycosyltransferase involved in cell wall biosynthesis